VLANTAAPFSLAASDGYIDGRTPERQPPIPLTLHVRYTNRVLAVDGSSDKERSDTVTRPTVKASSIPRFDLLEYYLVMTGPGVGWFVVT
jgi:hypothetical protein